MCFRVLHLQVIDDPHDQRLLAPSFQVLTAPAIPRLPRIPIVPGTRRWSPLLRHSYRHVLSWPRTSSPLVCHEYRALSVPGLPIGLSDVDQSALDSRRDDLEANVDTGALTVAAPKEE